MATNAELAAPATEEQQKEANELLSQLT